MVASIYEQQDMLDCALELGRKMILAGADVRRVEDTVTRVVEAYGATEIEVFTISSLILVSAKWEKGRILTQSKHIVGYGTNLRKLELYNGLARRVCATVPTLKEFREGMKQIDISLKRNWFDALCYFLGVSSMTMFFGGSLLDGLIAGIIALGVFAFERFLKSPHMNTIVYTMFGSLISGWLCIMFVRLGIGEHVDKIMIGVVFLFIPTLAVCNAIKDIINQDVVTGLHRLVEAIVITLSMTVGFFMAYRSTGFVTVSIPELEINSIPYGLQILYAFIGTFGFSVYFHIKKQRLISVTIGGGLAWFVFLLSYHLSENSFFANAIAAFIIVLYSEIAARIEKAPANIFLIPLVIPLLPGGSLYRCISGLIQGDMSQFSSAGTSFCWALSGIELGFLIGYIISTRTMKFIQDGIRYNKAKREFYRNK